MSKKISRAKKVSAYFVKKSYKLSVKYALIKKCKKKRKNGEGIRFSAVNVKRLLKKKEMGWQFLPVKGGESYLFPFTPLLYHTKSKLAVKPK